MYAVIRIRGRVNVKRKKRDILESISLNRVHNTTLLPKNSSSDGLLEKIKGAVTWGEISKDVVEKLITKRGRKNGKKIDKKDAKKMAADVVKKKSLKAAKGLNRVFRLSPPTKGFKSTITPFPKGDLGYRGKNINELIERMI